MLNVNEVAARYGVCRSTIWDWVAKNTFPQPMRLAPKTTRWKIADLDTWEAEQGEAA